MIPWVACVYSQWVKQDIIANTTVSGVVPCPASQQFPFLYASLFVLNFESVKLVSQGISYRITIKWNKMFLQHRYFYSRYNWQHCFRTTPGCSCHWRWYKRWPGIKESWCWICNGRDSPDSNIQMWFTGWVFCLFGFFVAKLLLTLNTVRLPLKSSV